MSDMLPTSNISIGNTNVSNYQNPTVQNNGVDSQVAALSLAVHASNLAHTPSSRISEREIHPQNVNEIAARDQKQQGLEGAVTAHLSQIITDNPISLIDFLHELVEIDGQLSLQSISSDKLIGMNETDQAKLIVYKNLPDGRQFALIPLALKDRIGTRVIKDAEGRDIDPETYIFNDELGEILRGAILDLRYILIQQQANNNELMQQPEQLDNHSIAEPNIEKKAEVHKAHHSERAHTKIHKKDKRHTLENMILRLHRLVQKRIETRHAERTEEILETSIDIRNDQIKRQQQHTAAVHTQEAKQSQDKVAVQEDAKSTLIARGEKPDVPVTQAPHIP